MSDCFMPFLKIISVKSHGHWLNPADGLSRRALFITAGNSVSHCAEFLEIKSK